VYHGAHNFCSATLSSFYLDILKDRLYTLPGHDARRRSAQTALYVLARDLSRLLAPILCFTTEEVWQELESLSGRTPWDSASIHAERFPTALAEGRDGELLARWGRLVRVREEINKALEQARRSGVIQASLGAEVVVSADAELTEFLRSFGDELRFFLITSAVTFGEVSSAALRSEAVSGLAVEVRPAPGEKCERCWNYTTDVGSDVEWPGICSRCSRSVREILSETGAA
jgi:isoleucyl-tRNA synthetase